MQAADKDLGERVLQHLLLGAQVDGIRFGPVLQLLVADHRTPNPPKVRLRGQTYINLGSRWAVFPALPPTLPEREEDLPMIGEEEQLYVLCSLREQMITGVHLGDVHPHLLLTLASGQIFFLNGYHEQYETWQCGVALGNPAETWLVVATPGGGLAIWAPEWFA